MYIPPNTVIQIMHDVPLDESYEHSIDFMTKTGQNVYFENKVKYTFQEQTYQRLKRGFMRVARKAEDLYDCNYLRYQNTAFGNKWFYAFIRNVEYVNNEVSQIEFEIDPLQTWWFDFSLEPCFVERMTPRTDYIGENIIPETVALGELVYNGQNEADKYQQLLATEDVQCYAVVAICDVESATVEGKVYDGIYGGATLYVYNILGQAGVQALNDKIAEYKQKPDAVLGVYYAPSFLFNNTIPTNNLVPNGSRSKEKTVEISSHPSLTWNIDGYYPHNYKLYTYPYNFINIINASGDAMALRYEFFDEQKPTINISGNMTQPVSLIVKPVKYKNIPPTSSLPGDLPLLDSECIQLNNYPLCSWNTDMYKAWTAQNSVLGIHKTATSVFSGAASGALTGIAVGNPVLGAALGGALGAFSSLTQYMGNDYKASISADIAKGNFNSGSVLTAQNRQHFYFGRMSVSYQYAKMIDNYFDRFGYAQNRIMLPETHTRPCWTYVKTVGCTLQHSIPKDDAVKITEIFDRGCLFFDEDASMDMSGDNRARGGLGGYDPTKIKNSYNPDTAPANT